MGYMGSMFGGDSGNEGDAGINFKADSTSLLGPTTVAQANTAYDQTQQGLSQQQSFLTALQGQNGIGNQSQVFNQQQGLADQLQGVANGTGPNPAMAQLNQTTASNVANQAALMAGQRGTSSNAGLLARQAAMQGANTQQQAVGQGATMAANQQLNAMGALGSQQANMANLATNQVGQQAAATTGYNQAAQGEQANLLNSIGAFNNANVSQTASQNSTNASVAGVQAQNQGQFMNKGLNALGSGMSMMGSAGGGFIGQDYASQGPQGGKIPMQPAPMRLADGGTVNAVDSGSHIGNFLSGVSGGSAPSVGGPSIASAAAWGGPSDKSSGTPASTKKAPDGKSIDGQAVESGQTQAGPDGPVASDSVAAYKGGKIQRFDDGGNVDSVSPDQLMDKGEGSQPQPNNLQSETAVSTPSEQTGGYAEGVSGGSAPAVGGPSIAPVAAWSSGSSGGGGSGGGSSMMSMLPMLAMMASKGAYVNGEQLAAQGKMVPGKASVKGDSLKNDTVPASLSPGEIVIPRSVVNSADPVAEAAKFVQAILAKNGMRAKKGSK